MPKLSLTNVSKIYPGDIVAVDNLSLDIEERDFVVLVGPSGCGKSTTLRMIAGLEEITSGDLFLDGRRINDLPSKDRDIAMVFQNYALYPHMSVYDNIAFGLKLRKTAKPEIKRRIDETARMLEIDQLLPRKPKTLSGGQRQRVAMGRAIVRKANIFLLDEPLSNLDAALRDQIRTELIGFHQKLDATFIYVTHDQTEAMTLGSKIVVMDEGVVQQVDSPFGVYNRPYNLFVAGFIGSPKMNFLPARLEQNRELVQAVCGAHCLTLSPEQSAGLQEYLGKEATLGVRPENIVLYREEKPGAWLARKEIVEMRGADSLVHLDCGGFKLTARQESSLCGELAEDCWVSLEGRQVHIFDKQSGIRL
ncbi:MAG: sn-glycerol-3-phosphate ABC transporter ATP-binding protein UgpC [Clostridiales bacterium]|jgi:multiple sugar transport system ATP-binding protein|nr:sn-glycerol-3-phosphate ABC transporter ATP-binding protein UgpC [Clostridiales bacterium]MDR2712962.1 sn-glycerol-3-phosphate ABC transporter ATP-binding protein UgpC [Clostridiales bacterium]